MSFDLSEFERYLKIDKHNLDEEIIQHPSLLFKVSDALAQANSRRDAFKKALDEVDATLDQDIRQDFENAGDKYTEGRLKNLIATDAGHRRAYKLFAEARATAARLEALQEAFKVRGYMLRDLVSLFTANYYETSSVRDTDATRDLKYRRAQEHMSTAREAARTKRISEKT